jgi:hypothetical protein
MKRYKTAAFFAAFFLGLVGLIFVYAMLWQEGGSKPEEESSNRAAVKKASMVPVN